MNEQNPQQNNDNATLQKNILDKIRNDEVTMRSKNYFAFKVVLLVIVAVLVLLTSSLLVSFIFFSVSVSGRLLLLGFGWRGFEVFFITFPWGTLLIDIIFVVLLESLLKKFQFGYRNPILYTLGSILLITVFIGIVIEKTPFHDSLLHREETQTLPPVIGSFYIDVKRPPHERGVFRGTVASIDGNTFVLQSGDIDPDLDDATSSLSLRVVLGSNVMASSLVSVGETIFVAGNITNGNIYPYGITKISAQ